MRRTRRLTTAMTVAFFFNGFPASAQDVDLAAAERQFATSCGVCHVVDPAGGPRQGPPLAGVYGRAAASLEGFEYSDALKGAGIVWSDTRLNSWIENSQSNVPGTIMMYRQTDPGKRAAIIAYLKSVSPGAN